MNYWTELSVEYANQRNYLDSLFKVYPMSPNLRREISDKKWSEIKAAFESNAGANGLFLVDVESDTDYASAGAELKAAVETTGGTFYEYGKDMTVKEIVRDIKKQEAMLVDEVVITMQVEKPEIPATILIICLAGMIILELLRHGGVLLPGREEEVA